MSFNRSACVVSIGVVVGALVYGCSSTSSSPATGDDAGVTADSSVHDAPADTAKADSSKDGQAVTCSPIDREVRVSNGEGDVCARHRGK